VYLLAKLLVEVVLVKFENLSLQLTSDMFVHSGGTAHGFRMSYTSILDRDENYITLQLLTSYQLRYRRLSNYHPWAWPTPFLHPCIYGIGKCTTEHTSFPASSLRPLRWNFRSTVEARPTINELLDLMTTFLIGCTTDQVTRSSVYTKKCTYLAFNKGNWPQV